MAFSRGRDFTRADTAGSPQVVIINETLARQYLPNADPVGQRITTAFGGSTAHEIVGVVRDIHDRGLNAKPVPTVYVPLRQFSLPYGGIVVQTNAPAESVLPEIRRRVAQADSTVALKSLMTIASRVRRTLDAPRFYTIMAAACASMAVLFVALGLFGVVSYAVSRRTAEIGIRMALGAAGGTILQDVLWQGLRIAAVGIVIGIGLSLAATRLLAALLFEVKPVDPPTLALASGVVVLVTLAASYLPARRASLVHPLAALRHE
jgi:hypothetical protein